MDREAVNSTAEQLEYECTHIRDFNVLLVKATGGQVWYAVRGTGEEGTKGERKVRGNVKSGISRRLDLYIYILHPMCTLCFAHDIRYVI